MEEETLIKTIDYEQPEWVLILKRICAEIKLENKKDE